MIFLQRNKKHIFCILVLEIFEIFLVEIVFERVHTEKDEKKNGQFG